MFIESGLISEGSIKGVMSGKHYNRSIRCHKVLYEALQQLRIESFLDTLDVSTQEEVFSISSSLKEAYLEGRLEKYTQNSAFKKLILSYEKYIESGSSKSRTFAYWSMYIKMIGKGDNVSRSLRGTLVRF